MLPTPHRPDYDSWLFAGQGGPHDDRPDPPEDDPGPVTEDGMCRACGCARLPEAGGVCPDCGGPVPPPPCPDDPGTGAVYTCNDFNCPRHGTRNRALVGRA